jgi:RsiW-degrading membrane proteinase PrsW (M82 family)
MDLQLIFLMAFSPSIALLWYIYTRDKIEPEPRKYVIATFLFSATVSPLVALVLEPLLPHTGFWVAFGAALIEEPAKLLAVYIPYRMRQMDGIMDGVVYGVAAGVGFAATENIIYGLGFGVETTFIRGFFTPIAHATFTAIAAVGLGLVSEDLGRSVKPYLATAILFHAIWNLTAFYLGDLYSIAILILNITVLILLIRVGIAEDRQKLDYYLFKRLR